MCDNRHPVENPVRLLGVALCLKDARMGFRLMRFNLVVSTNTAGIRCWRNGFQVVGILPGAFRHRQLGDVDAWVMVQGLLEGASP